MAELFKTLLAQATKGGTPDRRPPRTFRSDRSQHMNGGLEIVGDQDAASPDVGPKLAVPDREQGSTTSLDLPRSVKNDRKLPAMGRIDVGKVEIKRRGRSADGVLRKSPSEIDTSIGAQSSYDGFDPPFSETRAFSAEDIRPGRNPVDRNMIGHDPYLTDTRTAVLYKMGKTPDGTKENELPMEAVQRYGKNESAVESMGGSRESAMLERNGPDDSRSRMPENASARKSTLLAKDRTSKVDPDKAESSGPAGTVVKVTIGRVIVQANQEIRAPSQRPRSSPAQDRSLEDYLAKRRNNS